MSKIAQKKEGYGFLIDWAVRLGDLALINLFFVAVYLFLYNHFYAGLPLSYEKKLEAILFINLAYFISSSFVRLNISANITSVDKVAEKSTFFITLYIIILVGFLSIFNIVTLRVIHWLIMFTTLGTTFIIWHVFFRLFLRVYRRKGYNFRQVIIIGGGLNGIAIHKELKKSDFGYRILGFFDDNPNNVNALPDYLGKIDDINLFLETEDVDEIYCTLPGNKDTKIVELISLSEKNMIRFYLVPEFYKYIKRKFSLHFLDAIPILSLRYEPLQHMSNRFMKRLFDIVFSGLVLITIFPIVFFIFGIAIKLSSAGPIFFKQKRTGIKGEEFYCYKFRSMQMNNSANLKSATKEDPRITKIGAFMRKTSVDELPQFINVFKGEMSIVGPRPHMLKHTELYSELIEKFMVRHLVKPGITGWAQVTGFRGETKTVYDMEERVKKDVWYIENWTFFLDIKIIIKTVVNVFKGEDMAY